MTSRVPHARAPKSSHHRTTTTTPTTWSNTVAEGSHTHAITVTPGIVETTTPSAMRVTVDGNVASATATSLNDFDLMPY